MLGVREIADALHVVSRKGYIFMNGPNSHLLASSIRDAGRYRRVFPATMGLLLRFKRVSRPSFIEQLLNICVHAVPTGSVFGSPGEDGEHPPSLV